MSNDERLVGMRRTRGYWLGRLTRLSKRVTDGEASGNYEKSKLILMQEQLKEIRLGYEAIQSKMAPLDNEDPTRSLDVSDQFDEVSYRIGKLLENVRQPSTPTPETRDSSTDSGPISVRLLKMHLPMFDGTADDWESFHDTFMSAIDRNDKLTPVQKLHYLRTSLTGIAAQHIQSLGTTDANYANALASLKEKFDNPRQLCMNHWHAIANFLKMKNSTPEALEAVVVNFKQHLRALKLTGESLTDIVLNGMLISQLSGNIVNKWELTLTDKKMPPVENLLTFLEKRASCGKLSRTVAPSTKETTTRTRPRQTSSRSNVFITSETRSTCHTCKGQHPIWKCTTFKAKSAHDQIESELDILANRLNVESYA
ncbi:uncharacterized protein LOC122577509 [Bombus pyrosoma]|uniref:uncharacterized protein LOC122577509 n=1 Tax=Bombus pyrosoma TaxID=396416 RepID=UPI001CB91270|nr:uncharacterized protein LOC122577509 [Bombus pyrosoma]